jgi:hypothetical protein
MHHAPHDDDDDDDDDGDDGGGGDDDDDDDDDDCVGDGHWMNVVLDVMTGCYPWLGRTTAVTR